MFTVEKQEAACVWFLLLVIAANKCSVNCSSKLTTDDDDC